MLRIANFLIYINNIFDSEPEPTREMSTLSLQVSVLNNTQCVKKTGNALANGDIFFNLISFIFFFQPSGKRVYLN